MKRVDLKHYRSDADSTGLRAVFNTNEAGWFLSDAEMAAVWQLYQQASALTDRVALLRKHAVDGSQPHLVQHQATDAFDLDVQRNLTAKPIELCDAFIGAFTEQHSVEG